MAENYINKDYIDEFNLYKGRHTGLQIDELLDRAESGELTNVSVENGLVLVTDTDTKDVYVLDNAHKRETPKNPTVSVLGGIYNGNTVVALSCATTGAEIYYTLNGEDPTKESIQATSVTLSQDDSVSEISYTLKVVAFKDNLYSDVVTNKYNIKRKLPAPTISNISGDIYDSVRTVTFTSSISGVYLHYSIKKGEEITIPVASSGVSININQSLSADEFYYYITCSGWVDSNKVYGPEVLVNVKPMRYSIVSIVPTSDDSVEDMHEHRANVLPQTVDIDSGYGRVCFAYLKSLGALSLIKDGNGFDYTDAFELTTTTTYNVYTMKDPADQSGTSYTFLK